MCQSLSIEHSDLDLDFGVEVGLGVDETDAVVVLPGGDFHAVQAPHNSEEYFEFGAFLVNALTRH